MSSIDSYHHQRLGWIRCPVEKPPRYYRRIEEIAVYRLLEDTDSSDTLHAKKEDLLIGGGSGEWGFFRLSSPAGVRFALDLDGPFDDDRKKLYEAAWPYSVAYALCGGFEKVGWHHEEDIETWLAERVAGFAVSTYPQFFPNIDPSKAPPDWRSIVRPDFEAK
jgi:hypothetical protein